MKYNGILDLSEVVGEGFFADKVVGLLEKRTSLTDYDQKLLKDILNFVEKAEKGERQVESGRLGSDALDSIGAYSRAVRIIAMQSIEGGLTAPMVQAFREMLAGIKAEVGEAIKSKTTDPNSMKKTHDFFKMIRKQTLSEASKYYSRKVEVLSWPSLLY